MFDNYLSKCDAYYEAYWSMMDYLASEYGLEERKTFNLNIFKEDICT